MNTRGATAVLFQLELAESMRSRWMVFAGIVYAVVFSGFVWLGLRESSVLGFTGLSRVVLSVSNAVVLAVPLVALVATSQTIVKARQGGFFELMLSQPVRRSQWFLAALLSRALVIMGPLVALFVVAILSSVFGAAKDAALVPTVVRCLAITLSLAWAFIGIGFWISSISKTSERATVLALLAWVISSALHDFVLIGVLLRVRLPPQAVFALAASNPVEAARIAVLSGVDPELSVLGPVGFWLANTLGPHLTLAVGIGWPALLGTVAVAAAMRRLSSSDLVG